MESYFKLSTQFRTQEEPAYCGISSLVMVLNALAIDPGQWSTKMCVKPQLNIKFVFKGRVWKGVFRWYHEDMLDCCAPLETIELQGITADALLCLAKCNQLDGKFIKASEGQASIDKFRFVVHLLN